MITRTLPLLALSGLLLLGCQEQSSTPAKPETDDQKNAYSVGTRMGKRIKQVADDIREVNGEFDTTMYLQGIEDTLYGNEQLPEEQLTQISDAFQAAYSAARQEKVKQKEAAAIKAETDFLTANKAKEGVVETSSGLQYKVLTEGKGASPQRRDKVVVNYAGKLLNGEVFDKTDGEPIELQLMRTVQGWREALPLMKEGAKYELYIPSKLGYGKRKVEKIPPGSTLIFEVELVKVIPYEAPLNTSPVPKPKAPPSPKAPE